MEMIHQRGPMSSASTTTTTTTGTTAGGSSRRPLATNGPSATVANHIGHDPSIKTIGSSTNDRWNSCNSSDGQQERDFLATDLMLSKQALDGLSAMKATSSQSSIGATSGDTLWLKASGASDCLKSLGLRSMAKIIDIQMKPSAVLEFGEEVDQLTNDGWRRRRVGSQATNWSQYCGENIAATSNQASQNSQRTPATSQQLSQQQQQPESQPSSQNLLGDGGDTLSSFESDYDLLVYLGETETEDLIDTEKSLDYQDQTWRQSICGASLAPTIDESLSELLSTPANVYNNESGRESFDLLNTPTNNRFDGDNGELLNRFQYLPATRSGQQLQQEASNVAIGSGGPLEPSGTYSSVSLPRFGHQRQQTAAQLAPQAKYDTTHLVDSIDGHYDKPAFKSSPGTRQAPIGETHAGWSRQILNPLARGSVSPSTRQTIVGAESAEGPRGHSLAGNPSKKLASVSDRRQAQHTLVTDNTDTQRQLNYNRTKLNYQPAAGWSRSTGQLANEGMLEQTDYSHKIMMHQANQPQIVTKRQQVSREFTSHEPDGKGQSANVGTNNSEELDRLLAEMSQSLDLDSLARYDPFGGDAKAAYKRPINERGDHSSLIGTHGPTWKSAAHISKPTSASGLRATNANELSKRSATLAATTKTTTPTTFRPVHSSSKSNSALNKQYNATIAPPTTSKESILDEYDGASRLLEQMISDQLESATRLRLGGYNPSGASRQHDIGEPNPNIGTTRIETNKKSNPRDPPRVPMVPAEPDRKVSTCSSSGATTTTTETIATCVIANDCHQRVPQDQQQQTRPKRGEIYENRSVWRYKSPTAAANKELPGTQVSLAAPLADKRPHWAKRSTEHRPSAGASEKVDQLVASQLTGKSNEQRPASLAASCSSNSSGSAAAIPPPPPAIDYVDHDAGGLALGRRQVIHEIDAAEVPSSVSSAESGNEELDKEHAKQMIRRPSKGRLMMDKMKRRTLSSMRGMRDKLTDLVVQASGPAAPSDTTVAGGSQITPRPPQRTSSIGSRQSMGALDDQVSASATVMNPAAPAARPSRQRERRGLARDPVEVADVGPIGPTDGCRETRQTDDGEAASSRSFGHQLRERLNRSKSRFSQFLKPILIRRAQSTPDEQRHLRNSKTIRDISGPLELMERPDAATKTNQNLLFQPSDIARNSGAADIIGRSKATGAAKSLQTSSRDSSLERHLKANLSRDNIIKVHPKGSKADSSTSSTISQLDGLEQVETKNKSMGWLASIGNQRQRPKASARQVRKNFKRKKSPSSGVTKEIKVISSTYSPEPIKSLGGSRSLLSLRRLRMESSDGQAKDQDQDASSSSSVAIIAAAGASSAKRRQRRGRRNRSAPSGNRESMKYYFGPPAEAKNALFGWPKVAKNAEPPMGVHLRVEMGPQVRPASPTTSMSDDKSADCKQRRPPNRSQSMRSMGRVGSPLVRAAAKGSSSKLAEGDQVSQDDLSLARGIPRANQRAVSFSNLMANTDHGHQCRPLPATTNSFRPSSAAARLSRVGSPDGPLVATNQLAATASPVPQAPIDGRSVTPISLSFVGSPRGKGLGQQEASYPVDTSGQQQTTRDQHLAPMSSLPGSPSNVRSSPVQFRERIDEFRAKCGKFLKWPPNNRAASSLAGPLETAPHRLPIRPPRRTQHHQADLYDGQHRRSKSLVVPRDQEPTSGHENDFPVKVIETHPSSPSPVHRSLERQRSIPPLAAATNRLTNFAQHLRTSAVGLFVFQSRPTGGPQLEAPEPSSTVVTNREPAGASSDGKRRPNTTRRLSMKNLDEPTDDLCQWRPVIPTTRPQQRTSFGLSSFRSIPKDLGSGRAVATCEQRAQQQLSLDTDSTWDSSADDDDAHDAHDGQMHCARAENRALDSRGAIGADEQVGVASPLSPLEATRRRYQQPASNLNDNNHEAEGHQLQQWGAATNTMAPPTSRPLDRAAELERPIGRISGGQTDVGARRKHLPASEPHGKSNGRVESVGGDGGKHLVEAAASEQTTSRTVRSRDDELSLQEGRAKEDTAGRGLGAELGSRELAVATPVGCDNSLRRDNEHETVNGSRHHRHQDNNGNNSCNNNDKSYKSLCPSARQATTGNCLPSDRQQASKTTLAQRICETPFKFETNLPSPNSLEPLGGPRQAATRTEIANTSTFVTKIPGHQLNSNDARTIQVSSNETISEPQKKQQQDKQTTISREAFKISLRQAYGDPNGQGDPTSIVELSGSSSSMMDASSKQSQEETQTRHTGSEQGPPTTIGNNHRFATAPPSQLGPVESERLESKQLQRRPYHFESSLPESSSDKQTLGGEKIDEPRDPTQSDDEDERSARNRLSIYENIAQESSTRSNEQPGTPIEPLDPLDRLQDDWSVSCGQASSSSLAASDPRPPPVRSPVRELVKNFTSGQLVANATGTNGPSSEPAKQEQVSRGEKPPTPLRRKLVTMTSIIQEPEDQLMMASSGDKHRPNLANSTQEAQDCSGHRRDSNMSTFLSDDCVVNERIISNNNNSDSDTSFVGPTVANRRRKLADRFERGATKRPVELAAVGGPHAMVSSRQQVGARRPAAARGPVGGSLVRRLARNFDQQQQQQQQQSSSGQLPAGSEMDPDEPKSDSTWYDAKSIELLDEAEVAELLREFDATDPVAARNQHQAAPESCSSVAEAFVSVAESPTLSQRGEKDCRAGDDEDDAATLADEDTLNDEEDEDQDAAACEGLTSSDEENEPSESIYASAAADSRDNSSQLAREQPSNQGAGHQTTADERCDDVIASAREGNESKPAPAPAPPTTTNTSIITSIDPKNKSIGGDHQREQLPIKACRGANQRIMTQSNVSNVCQMKRQDSNESQNSSTPKQGSIELPKRQQQHQQLQQHQQQPLKQVRQQLIDQSFKNSLNNIISTRGSPALVASSSSLVGGNSAAAPRYHRQTAPPGGLSCASTSPSLLATTPKMELSERPKEPQPACRLARDLTRLYRAIMRQGKKRSKKQREKKKCKTATEQAYVALNESISVNNELAPGQPNNHGHLARPADPQPRHLTPPSSASSSVSNSPINSDDDDDEDDDHVVASLGLRKRASPELDAESLTKAAKKCSKLYDELERLLLARRHKLDSSETDELGDNGHLNDPRRRQSSSVSMGSTKAEEESDIILGRLMLTSGTGDEEPTDDADDENRCLSNSSEPREADQVSLSSSSMSSGSLPEISRRQNLQKLYYIVNEIYSSEAKFVDTLRLLNVEFRRYIQQVALKSSNSLLGTIQPNDSTSSSSTTSICGPVAANAIVCNDNSHNSAPINQHQLDKLLNQPPYDCVTRILKHLPQLQALNENLLDELGRARDQWPKTHKISHVLVKIGPFLKHYSSYIRGFEAMQQQFLENLRKYPHFADQVKEFELGIKCEKLSVQHHLLKPIQRIPQYRLLLQQYLHHLKPDDQDYEDTVSALEVVSRVAEHANQSMNEGINFAKLLALQAKIVASKHRFSGDIVQPGRCFIREGELMKVCRKQIQPKWFVLLSDSLLYLTPIQSSDILYLNYQLPLDDCQVMAPNDPSQLAEVYNGEHSNDCKTGPISKETREPNSSATADIVTVESSQMAPSGQQQMDLEHEFSISTPIRSFSLIAKSRQERDEWVQVLRQTIDQHVARRRSFLLSIRRSQSAANNNHNNNSSTQLNLEPDDISESSQTIEAEQKFQQLLGRKAPIWTPDFRVSMCQLCTSNFSALFRRHHCRACGKVVCSACSRNKAPLIYLKFRPARVCDQCFATLQANINLY